MNASYEVLAEGPFGASALLARLGGAGRPADPRVDAAIAERWERELRTAATAGRRLFNGALFRLDEWEAEPGGALLLSLGRTCYRDFVGTNLVAAEIRRAFGPVALADPVGTSVIVLSGDGRVVTGLRSEAVTFHASHVHTFGGMLEECDLDPDRGVLPFASARRELSEELGLRPSETPAMECLGLVRDLEILQPELLFRVAVDLDEQELIARWCQAPSRGEHVRLVSCENDPEAVRRFVARSEPIAPVAAAALELHARARPDIRP